MRGGLPVDRSGIAVTLLVADTGPPKPDRFAATAADGVQAATLRVEHVEPS
jgi:hypothetical protein